MATMVLQNQKSPIIEAQTCQLQSAQQKCLSSWQRDCESKKEIVVRGAPFLLAAFFISIRAARLTALCRIVTYVFTYHSAVTHLPLLVCVVNCGKPQQKTKD